MTGAGGVPMWGGRGRPDGRLPLARGKSGLTEAPVPGNARAGQPDGKRHRNETAVAPEVRTGSPLLVKPKETVAVRVKRWGKSPPGAGNSARMASPTGSNAE
ncbi:hypothetical protein KU6B_17620 [Mameliella alba]|nr:hypothetical protein KU6B_17620 [Mameliella alba]